MLGVAFIVLTTGLLMVVAVVGLAILALKNGAWDLDDDDRVATATIRTD